MVEGVDQNDDDDDDDDDDDGDGDDDDDDGNDTDQTAPPTLKQTIEAAKVMQRFLGAAAGSPYIVFILTSGM